MSRRKVVQLNLPYVKSRIKDVCRSNVVFSEKMDRPDQKTWVTGWGYGKNLPSPDEAARMCDILQVTPEEILTSPEDVDLVRSIIDRQQQKNTPTPDGAGISQEDLRYLAAFHAADENTKAAIRLLLKQFEEDEGAANHGLGAG